jgi:hypothetical protein
MIVFFEHFNTIFEHGYHVAPCVTSSTLSGAVGFRPEKRNPMLFGYEVAGFPGKVTSITKPFFNLEN